MLNARDTTFVLISRAPLEQAVQGTPGMEPAISSFGSDFNYDFRHAGLNRDTSSVQLPRREPGRGRTRSGLPPQPSHLSHLLDLCARL